MLYLQQVDLGNRQVLLRADLNVSVEHGEITSKHRIQTSLQTINYALEQNAAVLVVSHFGRPKEGQFDARYSLAPISQVLQHHLGQKVAFMPNWINGVKIKPGEVALGENVRFLRGEVACDPDLSRKMADLCDVFVMDAFGAAHRRHASTCGVAEFAAQACLGLQCQHEIDALDRALHDCARPLVAIVGGAKVDGKLQVLQRLSTLAQTIIVGGGIANTFIAARGIDIGRSLHDSDLIEQARNIMQIATHNGCEILLPTDVVVGTSLQDRTSIRVKSVNEVSAQEMILDIGPVTGESYHNVIVQSGTIIWNGPVGAFEYPPFDAGTRAVTLAVMESPGFSVAGGGDTLAALERFASIDAVSYASTGGGAFLEYVQGQSLPVFDALERHATMASVQNVHVM